MHQTGSLGRSGIPALPVWILVVAGIVQLPAGSSALSSETKPLELDLASTEAKRLVDEAYALREQQRYEDAEPLLRRALKFRPDDSQAHFVLGLVQEGMGRLEEALASHSRATELRSGHVQAWFERSRILSRLERYEDAIAVCTHVIELDPSFWQAWLGRGRARYYRFLDDPVRQAQALPDLDRAIELNPKSTESFRFRAIIHERLGRREPALSNWRQAVDQTPQDAVLHYRLGRALWFFGRYQEALVPLTRAIELDPAYPASWRVRGLAHAGLGHWQEAIADYSEDLRLEPGNHVYYSNRGMARLQIEDLEGALADLNQAIRLQPEGARYYSNRGQILARLDRLDEALKDFSKALELEPDEHPEVWSHRGYLLYQREDFTGALQDFERALLLDRKSAYAAAMAGYAAFLLCDYGRAVEWLTRAAQLNPRDAEVLEYRARAYVEQRQWASAIRDVNEAIRLEPATERLRVQLCWYELYAAEPEQAAAHALEGLGLEGLDAERRLYLAIIVHLGDAGSPGRSEMADSIRRVTVDDTSVWPGPVLRFLRGEVTREQLQTEAKTPTQQLEALVFPAWLDLAEGRDALGGKALQSVVATGQGFARHLADGLLRAFSRDGSPAGNGQP